MLNPKTTTYDFFPNSSRVSDSFPCANFWMVKGVLWSSWCGRNWTANTQICCCYIAWYEDESCYVVCCYSIAALELSLCGGLEWASESGLCGVSAGVEFVWSECRRRGFERGLWSVSVCNLENFFFKPIILHNMCVQLKKGMFLIKNN